jgi:hypothetical protein
MGERSRPSLSVPLLVAWAAPELCRLSPSGEVVYAHAFEALVGASGFSAGDPAAMLTGIVCANCSEIPDADPGGPIQFQVHSEELILLGTGTTSLDAIAEFQAEILESYHLQGGAVKPAEKE